jgi:ribose/xylose/arabinose/galactoside ABC-type transport system permease subunit
VGTIYGFANPFILLAVLTVVFMLVFRLHDLGRWVLRSAATKTPRD